MLTFSCNVGFTISTGGTTSATCQAGTFLFNPLFSGTQCFPNCAQDDATLDPLGNLDINPSQPATGNGYSFDTVLTYSCTDTSQAFVGESTLTCQTNGNYDNPVPACVADCGAPPTVGSAVLTSGIGETTQGTVVRYSCIVGLFPPADTTTTCEASGNWNPGTLSDCAGEPFPGLCGSPYPLVNGEYSASLPVSVGTTIMYQCLDGFSLAPGSIDMTTCESGNDYSLKPIDPNFPQCI
ncbi:CUB and sushi domain-containing protein 3-like [Clavelina lepadiformis]|uniref:CUB and sushi domain-containing protein 3-like n=1 Tax=Clavelina lepadiformis TaxID=159417 RepID=UPI004042B034